MKEIIKTSKVIANPHVEMTPRKNKTQLIIVGVVGISQLQDDAVVIKCHGVKMRISGAKILVNVLEHNTLEIIGKIEEIKIINGKT